MSKKKIGIITLTGYGNYGQKFQNYAVKKILSAFDFDSITFIVREPKSIELIYNLNKLFHDIFFNKRWKMVGRYVKSKFNAVVKKDINLKNNKKNNKFKNFCKKYIGESCIYYKKLPIIAKEFDYFVTGSDQVWSPRSCRLDSTMFLRFVDKEKRIPLSPSLGVNKIPYYKKKVFKKYISDFKHLSVREYEGAKIIKELTGKEANVLLDPTLSLSRADWSEISTKVKNKPKKYILVYVLRSYPECKNIIKDISNKYGLPVINVTDYEDFERYDIGPSEFIDLIKSARLVVTDSYHGTIFSMIYSIPFVISDNMINDSRFKSLEKEFEIRDRFAKNILDNDIFSFDFRNISEKIKNKKIKTYKFLEEALGKNVSKSKKTV